MSLSGFFIRFAIVYVGALFTIGMIVSLLGAKSVSAGGTAALLATVMGVCYWFAVSNKRYFTAQEKVKAILGMTLIDMGLQTLIALIALSAKVGMVNLGALGATVLFIGVLHALVIWIFVSFTGRRYAKELAAKTG